MSKARACSDGRTHTPVHGVDEPWRVVRVDLGALLSHSLSRRGCHLFRCSSPHPLRQATWTDTRKTRSPTHTQSDRASRREAPTRVPTADEGRRMPTQRRSETGAREMHESGVPAPPQVSHPAAWGLEGPVRKKETMHHAPKQTVLVRFGFLLVPDRVDSAGYRVSFPKVWVPARFCLPIV